MENRQASKEEAGNFLSSVNKHLFKVAPAAWLTLQGEERRAGRSLRRGGVPTTTFSTSRVCRRIQGRSQAFVSPPAQEVAFCADGWMLSSWSGAPTPSSVRLPKSQKDHPTGIFWRWERCPECWLHYGVAAAPCYLRRRPVTRCRPCREAGVLPGLLDASVSGAQLMQSHFPQTEEISSAPTQPTPRGPQQTAVLGELDLKQRSSCRTIPPQLRERGPTTPNSLRLGLSGRQVLSHTRSIKCVNGH